MVQRGMGYHSHVGALALCYCRCTWVVGALGEGRHRWDWGVGCCCWWGGEVGVEDEGRRAEGSGEKVEGDWGCVRLESLGFWEVLRIRLVAC